MKHYFLGSISFLEVRIIPESDKEIEFTEQSKKEKTREKQIKILSISNLAAEEKLQRASKKLAILKKDLKQNLTKELKIELDGLNEVLNHVGEIFGDKTWIDEVDRTIEKEIELAQKKVQGLEQKVPEMEAKARKVEVGLLELEEETLEKEAIKGVLTSLKDLGMSARKDKSFNKAIEILQDIDTKLLPAIEIYLPSEDKKEIRISLLKELETTLVKQGKIDEAIKVIDTCCTQLDCEGDDYIKSQINKSFLLAKKAEFNQAVVLLKNTLEYEKSLPDKMRKTEQSAEIKRALGIACRGQGSYKSLLSGSRIPKRNFTK